MSDKYWKDNGERFWVSVRYPSGIWRVQHLQAGRNGSFYFGSTDAQWYHHPSGRKAWTEDEKDLAITFCQRQIIQEHNIENRILEKLKTRIRNREQFIIHFLMACKETR